MKINDYLPSTQMLKQYQGKAIKEVKPKFAEVQDSLFKYFYGKVESKNSPVQQAILRTGPIRWVSGGLPKNAKETVKAWQKLEIEQGTNIMNCWDAVLYSAFQAGCIKKSKCIKITKALRSYTKMDLKPLIKIFGVVKKSPVFGDIALWYSSKINHVAIYLGNAPVAATLDGKEDGGNFIWQNSGLSGWKLSGGAFTHFAPFEAVNKSTSAGGPKLLYFRPSWWYR